MSRFHSTNDKNGLFETYLNTMMKNGKRIEKPRTDMARQARDKSINRNNNNTNNQLVVSRPVVKITPKTEELRNKPSKEELVHKEVYNNNMATVEVTVRTVAPKGAGQDKHLSDENREPWGKLLMNRRSDDNIQGTFGNFDPLRTLHFLSKELQMKMQSVCPSDPNVQQIVNDMQNAIQRLPPDVLSQLTANNIYACNAGDTEIPLNIRASKVNNLLEKQTQTIIIGDAETKKMQKQLEDSATKLEASCKEMEDLCNKLRIEKDDLETMLYSEKQTVVNLKKELNQAILEKEAHFNKEIGEIRSERDSFQNEIIELKEKLASQSNQSSEELRTLIEGLKCKQMNAELETTSLKNEITMLQLEKDKINVLLDCRDKQLRELRNELESIQQLVSAQMVDFKPKPSFSTTSSLSSTSGIWNLQNPRAQNYGKSIHELFMNNGIMRPILFNNDLKFTDSVATTVVGDDLKNNHMKSKIDDIQIIPQKEMPTMSQMTFSEAGMSTDDFFKSSHPSIKDMFAEIKRQAFKKLEIPSANSSRLIQREAKSNQMSSNNVSLSDSRASESS